MKDTHVLPIILVRCFPLEEVVPSPRLPPQHRQARYWLTEAEAHSSLQRCRRPSAGATSLRRGQVLTCSLVGFVWHLRLAQLTSHSVICGKEL